MMNKAIQEHRVSCFICIFIILRDFLPTHTIEIFQFFYFCLFIHTSVELHVLHIYFGRTLSNVLGIVSSILVFFCFSQLYNLENQCLTNKDTEQIF